MSEDKLELPKEFLRRHMVFELVKPRGGAVNPLALYCALHTIRTDPPKKLNPDDPHDHGMEPYVETAAVEIVSRALEHDPQAISAVTQMKERQVAILLAQGALEVLKDEIFPRHVSVSSAEEAVSYVKAAGKVEKEAPEITKGAVLRRMETIFPGSFKLISPNDPIPETTLRRFWKDAGLSHLPQDRGG